MPDLDSGVSRFDPYLLDKMTRSSSGQDLGFSSQKPEFDSPSRYNYYWSIV